MISIDQLFAKKSSWQFSRYPKKLGHNLYYPYGWFRNLAPTRDSPFSRTLPPRFQPRGRWLNESHLSVETAGKWKQGKLQIEWCEIELLEANFKETHGSSQILGSSFGFLFFVINSMFLHWRHCGRVQIFNDTYTSFSVTFLHRQKATRRGRRENVKK